MKKMRLKILSLTMTVKTMNRLMMVGISFDECYSIYYMTFNISLFVLPELILDEEEEEEDDEDEVGEPDAKKQKT